MREESDWLFLRFHADSSCINKRSREFCSRVMGSNQTREQARGYTMKKRRSFYDNCAFAQSAWSKSRLSLLLVTTRLNVFLFATETLTFFVALAPVIVPLS